MFFLDHLEHVPGHAVEVPFGVPAPLFAGGSVGQLVGPLHNFKVNNFVKIVTSRKR